MLNKNDPLIAAVQKVMQSNQAEREAVKVVNEKFGITDRKALPSEHQSEWDAAYQTVLTEGVEALDEMMIKVNMEHGKDHSALEKKHNVRIVAPEDPKGKHVIHGSKENLKNFANNVYDNVSPRNIHPELFKDEKQLEEKVKMSKGDIAALAHPKKKFTGDDLAALRAGKHKMEEEQAPKTDPYAQQQAGSVEVIPAKEKSVTPADQRALTNKVKEIVKEAKYNPYAIGMAAVKKSTGDEPPMEKKNITKAHKIAKKIIAKKKKKTVSEGFNDRHGLSVTASVEEQVVAEQARARSDYGLGAVRPGKNSAQRRAEVDRKMGKAIDTVAPFVPGVGAMRSIDKYSRGEQGLGQTAADVGLNLAGGAVAGGIAKGISKGYNYLRGGKTVSSAATAGQSIIPKISASGPRGRAPQKGPWNTSSKPADAASELSKATKQRMTNYLDRRMGGGSAKPQNATAKTPRPAADIKAGDARSNFLRNTNPTSAPASRPAADIKAGDMRSQVLNKGRPQPAADVKAGDARSAFLARANQNTPNAAAAAARKQSNKKIVAASAAAGTAAGLGTVAAVRSLSNQPPPAQSAAKPKTTDRVAPGLSAADQQRGAEKDKVGNERVPGVAARKIEATPRKVSDTEIMNASQYKQAVSDVGGPEAARKIQPGRDVAGVGKVEKGETIWSKVKGQLEKKPVAGFERGNTQGGAGR